MIELAPDTPGSRQAVIREAHSWLRTPYHHRGKLKHVGVDCGMFPICVYSAAGLMPDFVPAEYPPDWHLHRDEERYLSIVADFAVETDRLDPGNFLVYKWGRCFAHGAVIVGWPHVIHAVIGDGVSLARADQNPFLDRERKLFTLWQGG